MSGLWLLGACLAMWWSNSASSASWLNADNLSGQSQEHVVFLSMPGADATHGLLPEVHEAFLKLAEDARAHGIGLRIASAFRSFARQQLIWDQKAHGKRSIFDRAGKRLQHESLDDEELLFAMLIWSALPGMSRHHWGTEIDVYDSKAMKIGQNLRLDVEESRSTFIKLHSWLDERIASNQAHGFYRPYDGRGGIGMEPWHLSYRPKAKEIEHYLNKAHLRKVILDSDIALRDVVLDHFDQIYDTHMAPYMQTSPVRSTH
jgi:LAS superfamily LD-carboxypeptidase LdcB